MSFGASATTELIDVLGLDDESTLGAAVTLIKQTYALYWVAIIVFALLSFALRWDKGRVDVRKLGLLLGIIPWLIALVWAHMAPMPGMRDKDA